MHLLLRYVFHTLSFFSLISLQVNLMKNKKASKISISRKQFQLILSYTITDYKCQRETYNKAIVDLTAAPYGIQ